MITFNRIKIGKDATSKLKVIKGRTGLTPNLLCRIALCYSLEKNSYSPLVPFDEEGMEFNRFTLTGEYDLFFVSLIKEKCKRENLDPDKDFMKQFKYHLNSGINALYDRIKSISDLTNLIKGN